MPQRPSPADDLALWTSVDRYFGSALGDSDDALATGLRASEAAGLPPIQVSPLQGKLLHLLARAIGARRILEIGMLGGYSTTWLARALPPDGRLISLELEPKHAEVARANLRRAGVADRVEVRVGPAHDGLARLAREQAPPFDLVFIDADKVGYPGYLEGALALARPGALIVVDNVVRRGDVADAHSSDPSVLGVRQMTDRIAREPRLQATVVQTVGTKGYDGMTIALVRSEGSAERAGDAEPDGRRPQRR
jgi:predicted O-methyltransferase YrrM